MLIFSIKMNLSLVALIATLMTSCCHIPNNDRLDSNNQKTKIHNSEIDSLRNQIMKNLIDTISLTETFNTDFDTFDLKTSITNDEYILSNMPVASYNGQYIIVKFHNYSCCFDDGEFLRLYSQNEEVQTIQIYHSEDVEWTDATFDSVKIKIEHLINARNYYAMTFISKYNIKNIKQNSEVELAIEIFLNNEKYESKPFKMDSIRYKDSGCCLGGIIEKDYECKTFPDLINIWIDANKKMILIEYGIIHGLDGCDRGPFFKMVDLKDK